MKVYLYRASGPSRWGDCLYRAMSEHGEMLYEHISSSRGWGMSDLRGGLSRLGQLDGSELIESAPPASVRAAADLWAAVQATPDLGTTEPKAKD